MNHRTRAGRALPGREGKMIMEKFSGIYKRDGFSFRYNFDRCLVEYVSKASKEELADNEEWQQKYGRNLWDIDENGYIVIDAVGLRPENWKNKEARDGYLDEWIFDLREAVAWEMKFDQANG